MKSPKQSFNVLVELENLGLEPKATFDFLTGTIEPKEAITNSSKLLLNHYMDWLPEHCLKHECDLNNLIKLQITIRTNFQTAATPRGMNKAKELVIESETIWQAQDKPEQTIRISHIEVMDAKFTRTGIPEL